MRSTPVVRVIIVDDQPVVRRGLAALLDLIEDVDVVGLAADGEEALALVAEAQPDVVLLDLRMPGVDGVEATRRIRARHHAVEVVVLTTYYDDQSIVAALRAGARGYLTKSSGIDEIRAAIGAAAVGHAVMSAEVHSRLMSAVDSREPAPEDAPAPGARSLLTPREREVLRLIVKGLSNREIAEQLIISEVTVKTHINHIFAKTECRHRVQVVAYAYRNGLVEPAA